jgi:Asp-tRNA(Asn)/Glu-tRNA(Gln) amidotransferase A subunit family amidase
MIRTRIRHLDQNGTNPALTIRFLPERPNLDPTSMRNLQRLVSVIVLSVILGSLGARALTIEEATIADIQADYLSGETSAHQVVQAYLARIAAYDKDGPYINSIINLNPKALEEADRLDAALKSTGKLTGPLHGIPILVKDCIDAAGMPCTSGFQGWKNYFPAADAPVIARIKAAGGIILGKASLSEFTNGGGDNINSVLPGFCRNPYNTAYATGGSSGGTGASIASNFATVGLGTDTGGSVRMPSAHNSLVGLRPTVGLISVEGVIPNSSTRDTVGPMARDVTDLAVLMDTITKFDPADETTKRAQGHVAASYVSALNKDALRGVKLGVMRQAFSPKITDPRILANFEKALGELRAAGAEIVDPFIVPEFDSLPRANTRTQAIGKADMIKYLNARPGIPYPTPQAMADSHLAHPLHQQGLESKAAADATSPYTDPAYLKGLEVENALRAAFMREMDAKGIGAVILPTWAQLPVINGDRNTQLMTKEPRPVPAGSGGGGGLSRSDGTPVVTGLGSSLTNLGSSLQWPALSVPDGYIKGLPQGLQILGRAWDEARIIGYAYAYEQATHHRRPPPTVPPLGPES